MSKKTTLTVAIFGVGAMGTLFGSKLSPLAKVTLFGNWPEQIQTLRRDGLTITHPDGRQTRQRVQVTDNLNEMPIADVALILVKSHQTARAARQAANILRPGGLAITLQNGLGNQTTLAEAVGPERAALGITAQGATVLGPGHVRHAGNGPTYLARLPGREEQLTQVVELFNRAGLETSLVDNADSLVWGKLAVNAGINPLTALYELPNGRLNDDETLRQLMAAAAQEVAAVAAAQGIQLPYPDAARQAMEVARATASNRSSMWQDISRAAPTEIDVISGAVVRYGRRLGVPTPVNEFLLQQIKLKEQGLLVRS